MSTIIAACEPFLLKSCFGIRIFHGIYKDNTTRFSDPSKSSESAVEASALPGWQVVLQVHAKDIVIGKKKPVMGGGKKRKALQCSIILFVYM